MKKNQKFLIGLMVLSIAGGIGTTFALTRNGASSKNHTGQLDQAVYLYWGNDDQQTAVTTSISQLQAQVAQYRCVVVAPKVSNTVTGNVSVTFALSVGADNVLTGLNVSIYSIDEYATTKEATDTALGTLAIGSGTESYTASFAVGGENNLTPTKYYLVEFLWDGSAIEEGKTFAGNLAISQDFSK